MDQSARARDEERERELSARISLIRLENRRRQQRYKEVEHDRNQAESQGMAIRSEQSRYVFQENQRDDKFTDNEPNQRQKSYGSRQTDDFHNNVRGRGNHNSVQKSPGRQGQQASQHDHRCNEDHKVDPPTKDQVVVRRRPLRGAVNNGKAPTYREEKKRYSWNGYPTGRVPPSRRDASSPGSPPPELRAISLHSNQLQVTLVNTRSPPRDDVALRPQVPPHRGRGRSQDHVTYEDFVQFYRPGGSARGHVTREQRHDRHYPDSMLRERDNAARAELRGRGRARGQARRVRREEEETRCPGVEQTRTMRPLVEEDGERVTNAHPERDSLQEEPPHQECIDEYIDDDLKDIEKYRLKIDMIDFIVDDPELSDPILTRPLSGWDCGLGLLEEAGLVSPKESSGNRVDTNDPIVDTDPPSEANSDPGYKSTEAEEVHRKEADVSGDKAMIGDATTTS